MDAELDLEFFWTFLALASEIPQGKDSCDLHLVDVLGTYCMGGEL